MGSNPSLRRQTVVGDVLKQWEVGWCCEVSGELRCAFSDVFRTDYGGFEGGRVERRYSPVALRRFVGHSQFAKPKRDRSSRPLLD